MSDSRGGLRGLAFGVDRDGTLVTAHEVVDGLAGVRLAYPDGRAVRVGAVGIVPLPALGLALLRTDVAPGPPWPLADGAGTRLVSVPGPAGALQGAVSGLVTARYEASERYWLLPDVWKLALEQAPYGLPVHAAGAPVVDAETGAAVGVATAALRSRRRGAVLAVRLGAVASEPALADLLARNAETVPAHGRALNLAGVLELAAAGIDAAATEAAARRVPREGGLVEAAQGWDPVRPVLAVVGEAGSGRTTELAALALQRTRAAYRLPTLWLRGADLAAGDASVLDAADRALARVHTLLRHPAPAPLAGQAARLAAVAHRPLLIVLDGPEEAPPQLLARWRGWCVETVRRLRGTECRLVVGCLPEFWERMAPLLGPDDLQGSHLLGPLDAVAAGALVQGSSAEAACGAGGQRHGRDGSRAAGGLAGGGAYGGADGQPDTADGSWVAGGCTEQGVARPGGVAGWGADGQAQAADRSGPGTGYRSAGGQPYAAWGSRAGGDSPEPGVVALVVAGDPVALRLLAEVRAAQPTMALPRSRPLTRADLLAARLDLACLRIAERLAAQTPPVQPVAVAAVPPEQAGPGPMTGEAARGLGILWWRSTPRPDPARMSAPVPHVGPAAGREGKQGPGALRRSAARVAGRCHEAARRMLGAPDGGLTAREFDELFPWADGWAQAALGEGLFVAAGTGYRFASGALADWLQGFHLDLPVALTKILADAAPPAEEESLPRPVGAHRRGGPVGWAPPVPVPGQPPGGGVPRWRLAVVRQALLALGQSDPQLLESLLSRLVLRLDGPDAAAPGSEARWWAERLLVDTLHRLPDAAAHAPLLRALAARIVYAANATAPAAPAAPGAHARGAARPRAEREGRAGGVAAVASRGEGFTSASREGVSGQAAPRARWAGQAESVVAAASGGEAPPDASGAHASGEAAPGLAPPAVGSRAARSAEPFLPWEFWRRLPLPAEVLLDVLRVLVRTGSDEAARLLAEVLVQDPAAVLPPLCAWLADERVAGIAAETLFEQRHVALDELADALVDTAHPRADALLRALAQAEPSALARAVDRWTHDARPERHVAAATVLPLLARRAARGAAAERTLVRLAAEALLARGDEEALHGAAYAALVGDPLARPRHLRGAVARYLAGDPLLGAAALAPALDSDPALVLTGYAGRMREPGEEAAAVLRALGGTAATSARSGAVRLVREHLRQRPEAAAQVGDWLRARLAHGPAERETLLAFARDAAAEQPEPVRRRLAEALADEESALARELREVLNPAVTSPMRIEPQAHGKV